jgi:hypothetical protein
MDQDTFINTLRTEVERIKATADFTATTERVKAYVSARLMPLLATAISRRIDDVYLETDADHEYALEHEDISLLVYTLNSYGFSAVEVVPRQFAPDHVRLRGLLAWASVRL